MNVRKGRNKGTMSVRIIVDSGCDISIEQAKKWGVEIIPLKTRFGEEEFLDGVTMSHEEFFEKLVETDVFPQTSQIPPIEYEERFRSVEEAGDTAVCLTISAKLSGCYQSACAAVSEYQDCVRVVDSANACIGERILVERAAGLAREGRTAADIAEILEEDKRNIRLVALLDTLEYLKKGGRISATTAFVGAVLSIKPVIAVEDGEVKVLGKARGSKNGSNILTELIEKEGGINFDKPYCLAYSGLSDHLLRKYMKDQERLYQGYCTMEQLPVSSIGSAIGTHVGPGAIAAAFFIR